MHKLVAVDCAAAVAAAVAKVEAGGNGEQEVDFAKISIPEAFKLLNVSISTLPASYTHAHTMSAQQQTPDVLCILAVCCNRLCCPTLITYAVTALVRVSCG